MTQASAARSSEGSLSEQLLDAHVRWSLARLTEARLSDTTTRLVDDLLNVAESATVAELVDPGQVKAIARLIAERVPPSTAATTLVAVAAEVIYANPAGAYTPSDVIDRGNVERITDEALALLPLVEELLDDLTRSPLVATLASRFLGRVVSDVVATNRAAAEKIPGVGSLVSFGASTAGRMIGRTEKQFEQILGDTAAKGAAYAMGRLNKIIIATLRDSTTRTAVLEVFDMYADEPVPPLHTLASADDVTRIAALAQDVVSAGAPTPPVTALVDALIDGFFTTYGSTVAAEVIDQLDITRDDLVEHAVAAAPPLVAAARKSGELERMIRGRYEPFYRSDEVAAILG